MAQSTAHQTTNVNTMTYYDDPRGLLGGIAIIESGGRRTAIGDLLCPDGPAIGPYQIHQSAWNDISDVRIRMGLTVHPYHSAFNEQIAGEYALTFIHEIVHEFELWHKAPPTPALLYACYSLGPSVTHKIRRMKGLTITNVGTRTAMATPAFRMTNIPITSMGYDAALASRKMATGKRYMNLLDAHIQSIRETGIPLLWR